MIPAPGSWRTRERLDNLVARKTGRLAQCPRDRASSTQWSCRSPQESAPEALLQAPLCRAAASCRSASLPFQRGAGEVGGRESARQLERSPVEREIAAANATQAPS